MATYVVFHEVDDVEHWLRSPKRREVFAEPLGLTFRVFTDPAKTSRVALVVDIPDVEAFQQFMQTEEAAEAMKHDGVRPETFVMLEEASEHL